MPRKKTPKTARLPAVKVDPGLLEQLRAKAQQEDRSLSAVVRRALEAAVQVSAA